MRFDALHIAVTGGSSDLGGRIVSQMIGEGAAVTNFGHFASEAQRALERAMAAPGCPGREIADRGRKAEVATLLAQMRSKRG